MATVTISKSSWGIIDSGYQSTWSATQGATTGTVLSPQSVAIMVYADEGRSGMFYKIFRTFAKWDTSAYAGSITGVDFEFKSGGQTGAEDYVVQNSTAFTGAGGTLVGGDFDAFGTTNYSSGTWNSTSGGTVSWAGSAASVTAANTGEVIASILNKGFDYEDNAPVEPLDLRALLYNTYTLDLVLTYTPGYGNDVNGLTYSNIGNVNGVATADISLISGI